MKMRNQKKKDSSRKMMRRETTSLSSLNKRIKDISIDRLSALPDSLLIHILSFLKIRKAASSCVLSKRWQFLWTELPKLQFFHNHSCNEEQTRRFVSMVNSSIASRSRNNLESLMIYFYYDKKYVSDVNVWVEFVVKKMVKEVSLVLNFRGDEYTLPQMMFSNSSWTSLRLDGCIFDPQRTIMWRYLTTLYLEKMEIHQHVIEKILSGCPVLYFLSLINCYGFNFLEIDSQSVHTLSIDDWEYDNELVLEISAPYIHSLDISVYLEGRKLRLSNIPSIQTVTFDFNGGDWDDKFVELISYVKDIFVVLQHVKKLHLGSESIKVLAKLALNGWQFPQSSRECLIVQAQKDEGSIFGIAALLESSPSLETLVVNFFGEFFDWHLPPARADLDRDLLHLKTVTITNFSKLELNGKPMLKLAQILLKRATILEKMVIEEINFLSRQASRDFLKIAQTLLSCPRSSEKAVVILS